MREAGQQQLLQAISEKSLGQRRHCVKHETGFPLRQLGLEADLDKTITPDGVHQS
jgi:hypothetical protein